MMDPSKFAGMSWDTWSNHIETQTKPIEPIVEVESQGTSKLPKEDMKLYRLCPARENVELVVCKECDLLIKPQALLHHYEKRHCEILSCEKTLPMITQKEDSPRIVSPLDEPSSGNSFIINHDIESMSDIDVNESTKIKSQCLSNHVSVSLKRLKRLESPRSPLSQMCPNRRNGKKKKSPTKKKLNSGSPILLSINSPFLQDGKMEINNGSPLEKTNDGVDSLLQHLPEMSLNSVKEKQMSAENSYPNSFTTISRPPRALSTPPWFSCHKAGGLFYSGRHMNVTRQGLKHWVEDKSKIPNHLFQQHKARRKNTINWQTKQNDSTVYEYK